MLLCWPRGVSECSDPRINSGIAVGLIGVLCCIADTAVSFQTMEHEQTHMEQEQKSDPST